MKINSVNTVSLGEVLEYEQPTKYIVDNTNYDDKFDIPVLTAGKSFLLGYTNETHNVFSNVPVIIFDDFTTAFKYVDFPFKVKSSAMKILKANKEIADIRFLYYRMMKTGIDTELHKRYWISKYSKLKIPLPPIDQQKKIAAILDAADAYRQKTKALITKYDALTQSLFLDMFGDPVSNPKGWGIFSFKDVLEIRNGKNQKLIENKNGIYPICGSGGVMSYGDNYISEADSVIIGRKGNINKPILMKEKYWHVDTAFGLNPIRYVLEHDYLYWFCVRYNFEQHNKTVTIPSLTKETLLRIKIPIPPIELQNQFAERVQAIEAQKAQTQASLAQAEDLFDSLLQRAFKGELV